jgi:acyl-CoA synthetase (AMP-forming)/AMP-acid ligase II
VTAVSARTAATLPIADTATARRAAVIDADTGHTTEYSLLRAAVAHCTRLLREHGRPGERVAVAPDNSSGTGGHTKHVLLSHGNLATNPRQIHARHRLTDRDVVLGVIPWWHLYGMQMALNSTLAAGGTLVALAPPFDLSRFLEAVRRYRVTVVYLVPDTLVRLAERPLARQDLGSLRLIVSGGAPLPAGVAETATARLGVRVIQGYGMTEAGCTHIVADGKMSRPARRPGQRPGRTYGHTW